MLSPAAAATDAVAVTVLFATRNRAAALAQVLDRFREMRAPRGGWKLLVVDNGSTDHTAALLASYADRLSLTVLHEPVAGKNRALNSALPHLEGGLVVLTDDDVLPQPDWLVALQRGADACPQASLFGGTVLPHWDRQRPDWLTEAAVSFSVLYAQQQRAAGPCACDAIFGPNMAVRRDVFAAGFRFSETVGPDESRRMYAMGGETEFLRRVEAAGHTCWFIPDAVVGHIVRAEQLEEDWILHRGYRYGFGEGRHYAVPVRVRGGSAAAGRPPARLLLRALAYSTVARLIRFAPPSERRLRIRYKDRMIKGTLDAVREQRSPSGNRPRAQRGTGSNPETVTPSR